MAMMTVYHGGYQPIKNPEINPLKYKIGAYHRRESKPTMREATSHWPMQ